MASTKQINDKIYALITVLADHHGFDADEALELVTDGDVNYVDELHKLLGEKKKAPKKEAPAAAAVVEETDEVKKVRHNISLWEKKLDAGDFKDRDAHVAKIDKEKKKLQKLLGAEEKPAKAAPAPAPAKAAPAPAPAKEVAEKRIKRFSTAMSAQLGVALTKVGLSMTDKLKKEFTSYIEELPVDLFRVDSLADHMRNFAETKKPDDAKKPEDESSDEEPPHLEAKSAAEEPAVTVTREELTTLKMLVATAEPDVLWDAAAKRHVKGPEMDADEDMTEVTFKGKNYAVGDKTGRVYEANEAGDVFAGFKGVGFFKTLV
jgi:hypothetical protein